MTSSNPGWGRAVVFVGWADGDGLRELNGIGELFLPGLQIERDHGERCGILRGDFPCFTDIADFLCRVEKELARSLAEARSTSAKTAV